MPCSSQMTCCFLIQWWLGERKKECSASHNWSRPFQNVHPTGREKNGTWCSSHHRRRKERNKVVWLSKSVPPRTSPRFGYRTVRLVCGRFHCDNIKRERERERDVREILLGNNKERKSNGKKRAFCPSCVNVPRRPRREREKRERQRYSSATKTISHIFCDVNDEEERRTAWCLLWCSLQSNLRVKETL